MIDDIVSVLIRNSAKVRTNTPLEVLAAHMVASLHSFETTLLELSNHPFFAPGKRDAPLSPVSVCFNPDSGSTDACGLYRDRPGACASCDEE